jgi:predicted DNA-binding transcriptional regulator AlpA
MNNISETLLTEHEVARLLKLSVATIRRRRLFRQSPEWIKIGASVRYRREAIQELIETGTCSAVKEGAATRNVRRAAHAGTRRNAR